jgi:hypothetical protein
MSCRIKYENNQIQEVLDVNGAPSQLFRQISSLPFIADNKQALEMYMAVLNKAVNKGTLKAKV